MQPTEKSEELQKLRNGQVLHCLGFSEQKPLEVKDLNNKLDNLTSVYTFQCAYCLLCSGSSYEHD